MKKESNILQQKAPEEPDVQVTDTGIEYVTHKVKNSKTGEQREIRMFFSMSPSRMEEEGENHEEYRMRRKVNADILKSKKKGRVVWDAYMFGQEKGLSCTPANRTVVEKLIEQQNGK